MSIATKTHTVQLVAGPMHMRVTEAPDVVYFSIEGPKPLGFERSKLYTFFHGVIDTYRGDERRLEITGARSRLTGRVDPVGDGLWKGLLVRPKGGH